MKIIDNSPLNMPSVGILVEEACAVGKFYDNRFYLFAKDNQNLAELASNAMSQFCEKNSGESLFNTYDLEVSEKPNLENHPAIKSTLEGGEYNILMQLYTPGTSIKQFIVANIDDSNVFVNLALMMYEAERISKAYYSKAIMNYALENPEDFEVISKEIVSNKEFLTQYLSKMADKVMHPSFGMASKGASIKEKLNVEGVITHKHRIEVANHLPEKLKQYGKTNDPKLGAELELFFTSIDHRTWQHAMAKFSPTLQDKISAYINPVTQAKSSIMDLEIRHYGHIDRAEPTYGKYRLVMKKGDECLRVKFQLRNSFIVYLIYLLDRKHNGDDVDTLNLSKYRELFCSLYKAVYGFSGETEFDNMMKRFTQDDKVKQKGFSIVFHRMKEDIGDTCERMREDPAPFVLYDCNAHLTVLPQHIIIPDELMKFMKC